MLDMYVLEAGEGNFKWQINKLRQGHNFTF